MHGYLVKEISHYCNITTPKCSRIAEHVFSAYDFTFVLEGSIVYHINGQKYTLHKNDAIFLKPGTLRARESGRETVRYVSFNFQAYEDAELPFDEFLPQCITSNMRKLLSIYPTSHMSSSYYSREKCLVMLNYILYELLDGAALQCDNEHIIKILKFIDEHIHEKLSLQTISQYMNLSREYTSYIFKREMNRTLTDYVHERKLVMARELIMSGEMTLADVAEQLGFDNYNYFCRLFKRRFGMTPGSLRKGE